MKKRVAGFTLIELLVVIAIIGILSGIVLFAVNSARVKAQHAALQADAKHIITQIEIARTAQNKTLPQIEAGLCAYCFTNASMRYSDAPSYAQDSLQQAWQRLGFSSAPLDPWGNPFLMFGKEDPGGYGCFHYDQIYSAGPDGYYPTAYSASPYSTGPVGIVTPGLEDDYIFSVPFYICPAL